MAMTSLDLFNMAATCPEADVAETVFESFTAK